MEKLHEALSSAYVFCRLTQLAQNYSETKGADKYFDRNKYGIVKHNLKFNNNHHVSDSCYISILDDEGEVRIWSSGEWQSWVPDDIKKLASNILFETEATIERKKLEKEQKEERERAERIQAMEERRARAVSLVLNSVPSKEN